VQKKIGESYYCVEFYDERFKGDEAGSVIEIWIPIKDWDPIEDWV
jgi:predicted transcriptional regulator YdeE